MLGQVLIGLIAVLHVYILVLEMFLWDKPYGLKAFGNSLEKAQLTKWRSKSGCPPTNGPSSG